jgi:transposase InsO family protein
LIWALRVREHDCCGQKIGYFLEREYHVRLSVPKIYEILAEKYVIRSKWRKNQTRGAVPTASRARAVIQMDTVAFGHLFAFTGIDIYTKEAKGMLRPALTSDDGAAFLQTAMSRRFTGHVEVLQTDGGPEFKGAVAQQALDYCDRHRIARPYKQNEQAYIESFNRTLRKECLGWGTYRADDLPRLIPEVETFLARYHYHRPHLGFSPMRPPLHTSPTQEDRLSDFYGE